MKLGVLDLKRLMRANRGAYSRQAGNSRRTEAIRASYERKALTAFADHVVSKKQPNEEEKPMRTERMVTVSQEKLRNAIAGIPGLIGDV